MLMLALGVLAGMGLLVWRQRPRLAATACSLIALEFLAIPYPMWPVSVPAFYARLAQEPGDFSVLELPINWDRPDPLLYQTVHSHPLISAYTSRSNPLSIVERTPVLNLLRTLGPDIVRYDVRSIGPSVLSDLGVRYVINHPLTMGEGDERTMTSSVLQQLFGNRAPVVNEPNLIAYRVAPPVVHVPYLVLGRGWGDLQMQDGVPTRRLIEPWAQLVLPGPQQAPLTLSITASSVQGTAQLAIAPTVDDLRRFGPSLDLTATPVTVTLALPPVSEVWLTSDAPIIVYKVGVQ
jgi:hypothetical protein